MKELTVIDLFCGAGGFSEGFRQEGFIIKLGVDNWQPAIDTFNHNFNLHCDVRNILEFQDSIDAIESLPDTDIIIGSPPCVSFSHSNISGKADKSSGVLLTEIFLRIVAVKKFKKNSKLKAWFMENVTNSRNYLSDYYNFKDLNLEDWAKKNGFSVTKPRIFLKGNQPVINSADYGSLQKRCRVISGEIIRRSGRSIKEGQLIIPPATHSESTESNLPPYRTLGDLKKAFPRPNEEKKAGRVIEDPLYRSIKLDLSKLSDHFYDTGLYECEWKLSHYLKTNHPYMGMMSFPENETKPSRTVTATKIGASREALIYLSEFSRTGDGEFRTPTIREAATIMGFPITYQFKGSEGVKWRLVGNAVCPTVGRAFAKQIRKELGIKVFEEPLVQKTAKLDGIINLNTFTEKGFDNPPKKNKNSRFRRHPFKDGNMTVTLSNYDIDKNERKIGKWYTSVQYGTGEGFPTTNHPDGIYEQLEPLIKNLPKGRDFLNIINNGFSEKITDADTLQGLYDRKISSNEFLEPTELIDELKILIENLRINTEKLDQTQCEIFKGKKNVPIKQLFALYAINKISTIANK